MKGLEFIRRGEGGAEMPFLDHLEELRWRILWSLIAVTVSFFIGFFLVTKFNVLGLLIAPVEPFLSTGKLKFFSPADPLFISMKLAFTLGLILAGPIIVHQFWSFISPALTRQERRAIVPALYLGLVLFLMGVALAYFLALPMTLKFMMAFQTGALEESIMIAPYLSFVVRLLLAFGIVFELPVVILILATLGLVHSRMLREKRRYAILIFTIASSLLTPADIASTFFLLFPLMLLYEASIGLVVLVERRRAGAEARRLAQDAAERAASGGSETWTPEW